MSVATQYKTWKTDPEWFQRAVDLICDPYFEREFFTNLVACMDRKKSTREILEAALKSFSSGGESSDDLDRALLHLFYATQASSSLRESYQWLPMAQALFAAATFRSEGRDPIPRRASRKWEPQATTLEEFQSLIRRESRRVVSFDQAWSQWQFLVGSRSARAKALDVLVQTALLEADVLTAALLMKSIEMSFSGAWKQTELLMGRAFERFWERGLQTKRSSLVSRAFGLTQAVEIPFSSLPVQGLNEEKIEEFWQKCTEETPESVWSTLNQSASQISLEQAFCLLELIRGRCLYTMKMEQWPLVSKSLIYSAALRSAARWSPQNRQLYLATDVVDVVRLCQLVSTEAPQRPSGESLTDLLSKTLSKNQMVLRLDDACEKGDRRLALEILALIVAEKGLRPAVADRLLLMASKQDAWTYDQMTIPVAFQLTRAYQEADRLKLSSNLASDALFGLLRFLSDQRQASLLRAKERGHYEDGGLKASVFDVSGGARILDRVVFNQMRNAQRIQVWPSEAKG